jgi:hypothetical protein
MAPAPIHYWIIWSVSALFPLVLAAIGGYLAIKSLDPKIGRRWFPTVLVVATLGLVITGIQQLRAYDLDKRRYADQTQKEHDSAQKQDHLTTELADARSKLDSIIILVKNNPDYKRLLSVVSAMAQRPPAAQPVPPAKEPTQSVQPTPSPTDPLSPEIRLKRMVGLTEGPLHRFDSFTSDEMGRLLRDHYPKLIAGKDNKAETDKENARFQAATATMLSDRNKGFARLRAQALILRTQLLARLPPQPTDDAVTAILDEGNYNGGSGAVVANYLQKLASQLPDK